MFKYTTLFILMFSVLIGCKQPTTTDNSKPNEPQYGPIVVIQNPTSTVVEKVNEL